jgi:hypothetical protein
MTTEPPPVDQAADLLTPAPLTAGLLVGYARVSTSGQILDRQLHTLSQVGCSKIFADKLSGRNA